MLLAKGMGKSVIYLVLTGLAAWLSPWLGWALALGHPLLGALIHVRWCRSHGIDPVRVEPRDQYVRATTLWVEKLVAWEEERKKRVL
ncbi:MAG: hypothetical protein GXP62_15075 [Oligoflexia bacterium]|nr:hypothetical protein [Oligoflexia bacterium]